MCLFFIFTGTLAFGHLHATASARLLQAHRPSSRSKYQSQFRSFIMFCNFYQLNMAAIQSPHIVAFIEFLAQNGLSHASIVTYISALKQQFHHYGLNQAALSHKNVSLMLASCLKTIPQNPASKGIFTVPILNSIIQATQILNRPVVYTALFLTAFHSFLRISNILPTSASKFNSREHLSRGSIRFAPPGVHITITWSKTLQAASSHKVIELAAIPGSVLCPVNALKQLFSNYPQPKSAPLFSLPSHHGHFVITQSHGRAALSQVLGHLGLSQSAYTFHAFRRSGASLAFSLGVPMQYIQAHGTWASQAVWAYLRNTSNPQILTTAISNHLATF